MQNTQSNSDRGFKKEALLFLNSIPEENVNFRNSTGGLKQYNDINNALDSAPKYYAKFFTEVTENVSPEVNFKNYVLAVQSVGLHRLSEAAEE
jgi:hypothetical protein